MENIAHYRRLLFILYYSNEYRYNKGRGLKIYVGGQYYYHSLNCSALAGLPNAAVPTISQPNSSQYRSQLEGLGLLS